MYQLLSALVMVKGMEEANAVKLLRENFEAFKRGCPYLHVGICQITSLTCLCAGCPFLKSN